MSQPIYLITGPSGAGKSALAEYLSAQGYQTIDADSTQGLGYFANKNHKPVPYPAGADAAWWERHNYVWELDRLRKHIDKLEPTGKPVFLCGNAGNIDRAHDMLKAIFYLDIPTNIIRSRIKSGAPDTSFGQRVEERDQLLRWAAPFKQEMLDLGAIEIDATRELKLVARDILARVKAAA